MLLITISQRKSGLFLLKTMCNFFDKKFLKQSLLLHSWISTLRSCSIKSLPFQSSCKVSLKVVWAIYLIKMVQSSALILRRGCLLIQFSSYNRKDCLALRKCRCSTKNLVLTVRWCQLRRVARQESSRRVLLERERKQRLRSWIKGKSYEKSASMRVFSLLIYQISNLNIYQHRLKNYSESQSSSLPSPCDDVPSIFNWLLNSFSRYSFWISIRLSMAEPTLLTATCYSLVRSFVKRRCYKQILFQAAFIFQRFHCKLLMILKIWELRAFIWSQADIRSFMCYC